jgi:hypothetical protein
MKHGIFSRISNAAAHVIRSTGLPESWFNRVIDTGSLVAEDLREPYRKSVWVQRAIKTISGPISSVPLVFSDDAGEIIGRMPGERRRARRGPVAAPGQRLDAFWQAPALAQDGTRMGFSDFVELSVIWLKTAGEVFYLLDDSYKLPFPDVAPLGGYTPLIICRPDKMREMIVNGQLTGWMLTDANGDRQTLPKEQVIQLRYPNPYNPWRGLSEMESAECAANADFAAGQFNKYLNQNNNDTGPIIVAKNGIPNDTQRAQIIEQLREKRRLQQMGYYKPIFLTGDITIEDPRIRAVDQSFINQRLANRHEIALAFGVPASMFDIVASYSVGSASDRFRLIEDTCMPLGVKLCEVIDKVSARLSGVTVESYLDWKEHSVMQQVRSERLKEIDVLWGKGMPMEEISEYLGLDLPEYDGWDTGYLPFGVAPTSEASQPATDAATDPQFSEPSENADPKTDDAIEKMFRALKPCACHGDSNVDIARSPRKLALWKSHMAKRRPLIKAFASKFNRVLMEARAEVLAKVEKHSKSVQTRAGVAADFLFDPAVFGKELAVAMRNVALTGLQESGEQLFGELGKDDVFKLPPAKVVAFLHKRENRMSDVADTVYSEVKGTIETSLDKGDSIADMAKAIKERFNDISRGRATTVAMTETSAVYGQGRQVAMEEAGVEWKQWLTSGNDNVRAAHEDADGQTVRVDQEFEVGGEKLSHPGDPDGSAENVINCHCVSIAVESKED